MEFRILDKELYSKIKKEFNNKGGVYFIYAKKNNNNISINRILGTDTEGILYIGKADCFLDRVINLKKTISEDYKSKSHIFGRRYKKLECLHNTFKKEFLYIRLRYSEDPLNSERIELEGYRNKFGENPPLNRFD